MSEGSDKNGYLFPYTAEEDHLGTMSRQQQHQLQLQQQQLQSHASIPMQTTNSNDMNNPGYGGGGGGGSRMSSLHGSRTSSPPTNHMSAMHPIAPLTSITDTSE